MRSMGADFTPLQLVRRRLQIKLESNRFRNSRLQGLIMERAHWPLQATLIQCADLVAERNGIQRKIGYACWQQDLIGVDQAHRRFP